MCDQAVHFAHFVAEGGQGLGVRVSAGKGLHGQRSGADSWSCKVIGTPLRLARWTKVAFEAVGLWCLC